MDAHSRSTQPAASSPSADLVARMRILAHDMERARQGVVAGKIQPQYYGFLARMLEGRLEAIEAEVLHKVRRNN